ncbi:8339_t:CDS:2 [Rhizophagus irregularis]|nr:8339_t:CDS:2 [Rhizophagus irregularis]
MNRERSIDLTENAVFQQQKAYSPEWSIASLDTRIVVLDVDDYPATVKLQEEMEVEEMEVDRDNAVEEWIASNCGQKTY